MSYYEDDANMYLNGFDQAGASIFLFYYFHFNLLFHGFLHFIILTPFYFLHACWFLIPYNSFLLQGLVWVWVGILIFDYVNVECH